MAPFCMDTAKKEFWGRTPRPPSNTSLLDPIIHINTEKNQYQNIPATSYTILHASSLQNVMQNMESQVLPPLLNPRTISPPPFFFAFCFFKILLRLKINILSSIYPEINFPAEPMMKISHLSRPKVPAPPPPLRIKWSSP